MKMVGALGAHNRQMVCNSVAIATRPVRFEVVWKLFLILFVKEKTGKKQAISKLVCW